jgi:hypothetical protein
VREDELCQTHPRLYHIAAAGAWPGIQTHGLLSTSALLDLFEIRNPHRARLERAHRAEGVHITHPVHGAARLRDQKPMTDAALSRCLDDRLTPADWYHLLNCRVFFWPTEPRLRNHLSARFHRDAEHDVLTLDTRSLLAAHAKDVTLSPINSGSTLYVPQRRGRHTFRTIADYPFDARRRTRGRANAIAELAVDYAVPDVAAHTLLVERRRGPEVVSVLWPR